MIVNLYTYNTKASEYIMQINNRSEENHRQQYNNNGYYSSLEKSSNQYVNKIKLYWWGKKRITIKLKKSLE